MAEYENKHTAKTGILAAIALLILAGLLVFLDIRTDSNQQVSEEQIGDAQELPLSTGLAATAFKDVEISGHILPIPEGFEITEYAAGLEEPRFMAFDDANTLYVGSKHSGKVLALTDSDQDGIAETRAVVDEDLEVPHSVFFHAGDLWVAEEKKVNAYRQISADGSYSSKDTVINLPEGDRHTTRTVVIGPDEKIYVSIGSGCNACEEEIQERATIMRYNLDGSGGEIYASGLRNAVGIIFDELDQLWAVDVGRDELGDDIPPEELNLVIEGHDYGWPYCYGQGTVDPEYSDKLTYCMESTSYPFFELQAHSTPLGIAEIGQAAAERWPTPMKGAFVLALHGSWDRSSPVGYKVVWVDRSGEQLAVYDLVRGWLDADSGEAWGRPAGIVLDSSANVFISDDRVGIIYKLSPIAL